MRRTAAALALAAALAAALGVVVTRREGNLAWDDADYLRRGLRIANRAADAGPARFVRDVVSERPKPPMLVAWIASAAAFSGRGDVRPLILAGSVAPFALLMGGVVFLARRQGGDRAAPVALLALAASPLTLSFGAKVMVETFLGLWIALALHAAALLLDRPTRGRAALLGAALGLAALTKMTVALLLPLPALGFAAMFARRHPLDRRSAGLAGIVVASALLVAGPWYAENGAEAIRFARFSARYNVEAEGRSDRVPTVDRLAAMAGQVAGWPALAALGLIAASGVRDRSRGGPGADFAKLAALAAAGGSAGLLVPTYFDPRFLLPAWPSVAVAAGVASAEAGGRRRLAPIYGLLLCGAAAAFLDLRNDPATTTSWAARDLIQRLVDGYDVKTIGNVGNTGDWNVCKMGLCNELRARPEGCFVLHDLSKETPEGLSRRLARLDAVIVLDRSPLLDEMDRVAPAMNRAHGLAAEAIAGSGRFRRVETPRSAGLPPLAVYVRRPPATGAWRTTPARDGGRR